MFKLIEATDFWWPVKVEVPDGGKHRVQTFDGQFEQLSQDEIMEILHPPDDEEESSAGQGALAARVLTGWKGIGDEAGEEIAYSETSKSALLNIPYVRRAVIKAYLKALGGKEAAKGN